MLAEDLIESIYTPFLHLPGTPESVVWAPFVVSQFGGWGDYAKAIGFQIGDALAREKSWSYSDARRYVRVSINRLTMRLFARKLLDSISRKHEESAEKRFKKEVANGQRPKSSGRYFSRYK